MNKCIVAQFFFDSQCSYYSYSSHVGNSKTHFVMTIVIRESVCTVTRRLILKIEKAFLLTY